MKYVAGLLVAAAVAVGLLVTVGGFPDSMAAHAGTSPCSPQFAGQFSWGGCFPDQIPAQLLDAAPIPIVDPGPIVRRLTLLPLNGIFVAYLGSDDLDRAHPKGPLMAAEYAFGSPPRGSGAGSARRPSYVTVWEDGYEWWLAQASSRRRLEHGPGWWADRNHFTHYRMEFQVSTDGTKQQVTAIARALTQAVHARPVRPAPGLRLYVKGPGGTLQSGHPARFFILNNGRAALQPAVFDLVLQGGWKAPKIEAAYSGQACGGDNIPGLTRGSATVWDLQFGDCDEIELIVAPTGAGFHRLQVRTYRAGVKPDGSVDPTRRSLVPCGGYIWEGRVQ